MKKVIVIYDDSRKPSQEIKAITGKKSFGNTILRRKSLKDRMKDAVLSSNNVCAFFTTKDAELLTEGEYDPFSSVVIVYSDHQMTNVAEGRILLEKAGYVNEVFRVVDASTKAVAAIMYPSMSEYRKGSTGSLDSEIVSNAFTDLSDVTNFRQFITSGFDARFFNSLTGDEYTVVKYSDNIEKLKAEYMYYKFLPESMLMWYAPAYDYKEENGQASYKMERFHMTDLAIRYVHGAIEETEFRAIMDKLFYFLRNRVTKQVTAEEYDSEMMKLYVDKVKLRIEKLKNINGYEAIDNFIKTGTSFEGIDDIFGLYMKIYNRIVANKKFNKVLVAGHGDLCFSNILYNHDANILKLIDPKGATSEDELYMNPYYDIAKLSHSICGNYDFFNSDLFEISLDNDMKFELKIDSTNERFVSIFMEYLNNNNIDFSLIRLYEASLFLSMLPLHMDRPKKVFGFILNAVQILLSLEEIA